MIATSDLSNPYAGLFDRIREAFPGVEQEYDLSTAQVNTDGLVNIAVILGPYVYRFARNEYAIAALRQESLILNRVRRAVQLPVPVFESVAEDFVRYAFLPGEALFRNDMLSLPEAEQDRLAEQLAAFLHQMHGIPRHELTDVGTSGGRQTQAEWLELYEAVQRELFPLMYRSTQTWVHRHFAPLVGDNQWLEFEPALIHDDLAQYHILYDSAERRISGVIDFGTAGLGDPARDYGILINVYGETVVARMAKYDSRIPALLNRARFYAGVIELQWVLAGVRSKSFDWFTAHLDRARDAQPYQV